MTTSTLALKAGVNPRRKKLHLSGLSLQIRYVRESALVRPSNIAEASLRIFVQASAQKAPNDGPCVVGQRAPVGIAFENRRERL